MTLVVQGICQNIFRFKKNNAFLLNFCVNTRHVNLRLTSHNLKKNKLEEKRPSHLKKIRNSLKYHERACTSYHYHRIPPEYVIEGLEGLHIDGIVDRQYTYMAVLPFK